MAGAIGEPLDRVDGRLKVTGQAVYTADWQIPNLAHAVLVTSSIAAGRIASIDTHAAKQVPGVIAVLTHYDRLPVAQDPSKVKQGEPADRALQLLQDDRVLYGGQPVAVAIAETLEAANEAAEKVLVHYEARRPSITFAGGLARSYIPEKAGGGKDPGEKNRGDFHQAIAAAPVKVENIYSTPFHTHNPMEPHATVAVWDGPEKLTLYDTSQGIFGDRARVAGLLGLKPENVRVVCLYVGGGFGSKGPTWSHSPLCAMVARHVGRPVKLVLRRPQMFGPVGCRTETQQAISLGASPDGKLAALSNETLSHTSTFDEFTETATLPSRMLYSVPNNYTVQRLIRSDIGTPSYTRAPGEAPGTFTLEIAMDELAYRLGMDPVELRLRNYAEKDEDKNLPWSTKSLRECYRRGADRFGWAKRNAEPRSMRQGKKLVGWGMATSVYPARRSPASAVARMYPDGSVHVDAGSQDLGTGTYTIMTQIAADAVGVPVSDVVFRLGDTRFPETPVSGGSQTAATCGTAVFEAGRALRDRIRSMGGDGVALREIVARSGQPYVEAKASSGPNEDEKKFSSYSFGAQFAEVHVDADVGQVFVARMTGVFAAGTILNAKTARSQFMGGMVWGISLALQEHSAYDRGLGRIVNNNLAEYHVPVNADIGEIDVSWVEENDPHVSAVGAKGIGEIGITGSAAAVANAIFHATGNRIREAPITPDQLIT
ncbi:MAG TPA: xanthine dehydrogenase family protein molybdopterin-binding subunit [Bryobacteraceae bacterium]|nr:xanthine dehydrogenase family protein molybdopterin-binding subunit [Bryobacteraceae bacterium]